MYIYFIVCVALWLATLLLYKYTQKSADDYVASFVVIVLGVIAIINSVIYVAMAFWKHRFF